MEPPRGQALHPLHDYVAHGAWDPHWIGPLHWRIHPRGTDDWNKDFNDGHNVLVRDYEADGHPEKVPDPMFKDGRHRQQLTRLMTIQFLNEFKRSIEILPDQTCYCEIYAGAQE